MQKPTLKMDHISKYKTKNHKISQENLCDPELKKILRYDTEKLMYGTLSKFRAFSFQKSMT